MIPTDADTAAEAQIVAIEDEPDIGALIRFALRNLGTVVVATSGTEGLLALERGPTALAIVDANLPDMDGYELARAIHGRYPGVPIMFLTARAQDVDRERGMAAGAVDYVTKPIDLAEFRYRVSLQLTSGGASPDSGS